MLGKLKEWLVFRKLAQLDKKTFFLIITKQIFGEVESRVVDLVQHYLIQKNYEKFYPL